MLTVIQGGRVIDPATGRDEVGDLWLSGGQVVHRPDREETYTTFDAAGSIVMAGAIDVHSHIAGGNVALARLLLPDLGIAEVAQKGPGGKARWTARETGRLYAQMGYTTVVEPAMPPTWRSRPISNSPTFRSSTVRRLRDGQ